MSDRLTSTLIEASNLYQSQLADAMLPSMLNTFQHMRKTNPRLRDFQKSLTGVVNWNKDTIDACTNKVLLTEPLLDRLIAAVYLGTVQVLAHVRLPKSDTNIKVQVPGTGPFVHTAYKLAAREVYERIVDRRTRFEAENLREQKHVMFGAVHSAINKLLPFKQLLEAYIAKEVDDQGMVSPEPYMGTAHAYAFDDKPISRPFPVEELPEPRSELEPEPQQEQEAEPQPEPEPEREPEREREREPEPAAPSCWLDDGRSQDEQPEEKRITLSPGRREVMCDDAGDSGELD